MTTRLKKGDKENLKNDEELKVLVDLIIDSFLLDKGGSNEVKNVILDKNSTVESLF